MKLPIHRNVSAIQSGAADCKFFAEDAALLWGGHARTLRLCERARYMLVYPGDCFDHRRVPGWLSLISRAHLNIARNVRLEVCPRVRGHLPIEIQDDRYPRWRIRNSGAGRTAFPGRARRNAAIIFVVRIVSLHELLHEVSRVIRLNAIVPRFVAWNWRRNLRGNDPLPRRKTREPPPIE